MFSVAASLMFLFFFWRKLKEDYTQNQIFSVGFYSLFGALTLNVLSNFFYPSHMFWLSMAGSLVGLLIGIRRFRFRFFETLEAWVLGSLGILLFFYLYELTVRFEFEYAVGVLVSIFFIFLFFMLDKYYKKFTWYKSGKVGFTGLTTLGVLFLVRCVIAIALPGMLFFVGSVDAVLSAVLAFTAFLSLFNLSKEQQ